mgnify:CR=1 FL=1
MTYDRIISIMIIWLGILTVLVFWLLVRKFTDD